MECKLSCSEYLNPFGNELIDTLWNVNSSQSLSDM